MVFWFFGLCWCLNWPCLRSCGSLPPAFGPGPTQPCWFWLQAVLTSTSGPIGPDLRPCCKRCSETRKPKNQKTNVLSQDDRMWPWYLSRLGWFFGFLVYWFLEVSVVFPLSVLCLSLLSYAFPQCSYAFLWSILHTTAKNQ